MSDAIDRYAGRRSPPRPPETQVGTPVTPTRMAVYKATAGESGGEVSVKRVEADGDVVGDAITLQTLEGMEIEADDLVIAVTTADGKRAAYKGGGGTGLQVAKFDGSRSGKRYTGHIVKDDGTLETSIIQWLFDWGNDPGLDDVVTANKYVCVLRCPTWLQADAAYGVVGTYGEKYVALPPIWGVLR